MSTTSTPEVKLLARGNHAQDGRNYDHQTSFVYVTKSRAVNCPTVAIGKAIPVFGNDKGQIISAFAYYRMAE